MATYQGQTVDWYENFESTPSTGFTETDTGGFMTYASGTQYKGGTHSAEVAYNALNAVAYCQATPNANCSFGFWYRTGTHAVDNDYTPKIMAVNQLGYGDALTIDDRRIDPNRFLAIVWKGSTVASPNVSNDAWYWITVKMVRNGTSRITIYDSSQAEVLSDTALTTSPDNAIYTISIGSISTDAHTSMLTYYDDFCVDYTNSLYPILGWAGGGASFNTKILLGFT